jgi:hypothetical protein
LWFEFIVSVDRTQASVSKLIDSGGAVIKPTTADCPQCGVSGFGGELRQRSSLKCRLSNHLVALVGVKNQAREFIGKVMIVFEPVLSVGRAEIIGGQSEVQMLKLLF